ncbi:autotransporter-associated beta strand repeat-containing protein [Cephaloticoccus primus]|uniref:autotransporter-associated beta strand repeat-containing protein n=1 Tax=Cephaloticoccus primus TaxID=1548207 RepID=UPI0012E82AC4|nr:autotransporter-associated beta strand repeat-containing protein [Cephaloticoccus primus]
MGLFVAQPAARAQLLPPTLHIITSGSPSEITLQDGGTLAFRSSTGVGPAINVSGEGVERQIGGARIGAIYAEIGKQPIARTIVLYGNTSFGGRSGMTDALTLSNVTQSTPFDSHDFIKVGSGLVILGSTNEWGGATRVDGGVLRLSPGSQLPAGNIRFNGGILQLSNTDFHRTLGVGDNQIQWFGDGGFSALDVARTVTLSYNGVLTWGQGHFVSDGSALLLNSRYSGEAITLTNPINLGAQLREVRVASSLYHTSSVYSHRALAKLTGILSGTGGLEKTGGGLLYLTGANTYTGATLIRDGILRGTVPNSSNILLDGGVLGIDSDFTRGRFGTGGRIIWQGSGGFAAFGADRIVRIDNTTAPIGWGWNNFVPHGQELRFGHVAQNAGVQNGTVIWDRALAFGNAMRTIRVRVGPGGADAVRFTQPLSNSTKAGGLRLVGDGTATLAADSPDLDSDRLEISGANLKIIKLGRLGPVGSIEINSNGTLTNEIVHGAGETPPSHFTGSPDIVLNSGRLAYIGTAGPGGVSQTEKFGTLFLIEGWNQITGFFKGIGNGTITGTIQPVYQFDKLSRAGSSRATLYSGSSGVPIDSRLWVRILADAASHLIGGIIPWAVTGNIVSGEAYQQTVFTTINNSGYLTAAPFSSSLSGNYRNTTPVTISSPLTLNSLYVSATGGITLNSALTISSGGLIKDEALYKSGAGMLPIFSGSGTITTAANRPLYFFGAKRVGGADVSGSVRFIGGMDFVIDTNTGIVYNSSGISSVGSIYINRGDLDIASGKFWTSGQVHVRANGKIFVRGGDSDRLASRPRVNLYGGQLTLFHNATQTLSELHIADSGVIEFRYGSSGPNFLFLDLLTFNNTDAKLFVKGWHEFENYLLIKKTALATGQWAQVLKQIDFDGYSLDYDLLASDYNNDYFQISPWGSWSQAIPEPSTYGAILGALGVGAYLIRRKRQTGQRTTECAAK